MVTFQKNPIRVFNGMRFYDVSDQTVASPLFSSVEMERSYAYGHPCVTGDGLTPRGSDSSRRGRVARSRVRKSKVSKPA
jgi:hypothetical protein